jgi:CRISPR-associated protein (TIGR03984 family)
VPKDLEHGLGEMVFWPEGPKERGMTALFIHTAEKLALPDALRAFTRAQSEEACAVALAYTPKSCLLGLLRNGTIVGPKSAALDLAPVFEARVFNRLAELRWVNDPSPQACHRSAILSETDLLEKLNGLKEPETSTARWSLLAPVPIVEPPIKQQYLLWGKGIDGIGDTDWSRLATPRIGAFDIPIPGVHPGGHVYLKTVEYLYEVWHDGKTYGNVAILDERLVTLEVGND